MVSYRDLILMLRDLGLESYSRVLVHASLDAFEQLEGGSQTLVGALLETCETVIMPAFTRRTMVIPECGPPDNAIQYGSADEENGQAAIFAYDLPVDAGIGDVAEQLRLQSRAMRSGHPILSFAGVNAEEALARQTLESPLGVIDWLAEYDGDVLLIGVGHRRNFSLHYAENLVDRRTFLRWALTISGVVECPNMPGCTDGFQAIAPRLDGISRRDVLDGAPFELVPVRDLLNVASGWLREDPDALLCSREDCPYCSLLRHPADG